MKTIEERADDYAHQEYVYSKEDTFRGYFHGATDQKEIDVKKACSLYEDVLWHIYRYLNYPMSEDEYRAAVVEPEVKKFREEMEE